jgi:hypothetical protein
MKKRLILLAGVGIGFVIGSYSGRSSYEKLRARFDELVSDPRVREQVGRAGEAVKDKAPEVAAGVKHAAAAAAEKAGELKEAVEHRTASGTGDAVSAPDSAEEQTEADLDLEPEHIPPLGDGEITVDPDSESDPETPMEDEGPLHER